MKQLMTLKVADVHMGAVGGSAFGAAMESTPHPPPLRTLVLKNIGVGQGGANSLCRGLTAVRFPRLEVLEIEVTRSSSSRSSEKRYCAIHHRSPVLFLLNMFLPCMYLCRSFLCLSVSLGV